MMFKIAIVVALLHLAASKELPSFINACHLSDPNFEQCCLESGQKALPHIVKGYRKFDIPVLDPLKLSLVELPNGRDLNLTVFDLVITGLKDSSLTFVKVDPKNGHANLGLRIPRLQVLGTYKVNGKILVLPITGTGPINMTAIEVLGTYKFHFTKLGAAKHATLAEEEEIELKLQRMYYHLENLFDGDSRLGPEMNKFMNENWEDVYNDLGKPVKATVATVLRTIASNVFKRVPMNELFPQ